MKTRWMDIFALLVIVILALVFFWKFFFPTPQLLVTPDYGRSDAWHFSFPTKFFLSQSLKQNTLPLWSKTLGGGFPLFAEGQIGALFLPNLILYKFLDPVTAYNISLMLVVITIGWGMYVWLRLMGLDPLSSLFGGVTIAFSGPIMTQLPHIALLQGFSMLPWVMSASGMLTEKKSLRWIVILAVLITQQIFAGFPQASFITMLFAGIYFLWLIGKKIKTLDVVRFGTSVALAIGLSAVQLLPSVEFLQQSTARDGFSPQDAAYFSYPFKHLVTFFNPYQLGNPKLATYPAFPAFDGSIFWENTGFIGIIPLILIALVFLPGALSRGVKLLHTRCVNVNVFLIFIFLSFLLMLGSHSPLYIIYSFWPFNLFRVPSRFLWIFVSSLIILAAMGMQILQNSFKRGGLTGVTLVLIIGFHAFSLMKTWGNYHAIQPTTQWLSKPSVIQSIQPNDRIYTVGSELMHNQTFLTKGWQDMTSYDTLRNSIAPDSNLLWNTTTLGVYAGRFLRRQALTETLLSSLILVDTQQATVSAQAKKILDIFGVNKIVSAVPFPTSRLSLISEHSGIYVYNNADALPRVYLARSPVLAQTFEEAARRIQDDSFIPGKSILVEQSIDLPRIDEGGSAHIVKEEDTSLIIRIEKNPARAILVLGDTWYPGWKSTVDGNPVEILPANIRSRGVIVPSGDHTITFQYQPTSMNIGSTISLGTLFLIGVASLLSFVTVRTHPKVFLPLPHRRHNRGR